MSDATVNIVDVVPDAIQVQGSQLRVGDEVFDAYGGTHEIRSVTPGEGGVWFVAHNGREYIANDATITIMRCSTDAPGTQ